MNLNEEPEQDLLELARRTQRMRARIAEILPRNVFRDSAWDIMLELFTAAEQKRVVCIKELILVSGETSTSALRRIDRLEAADLLCRSHDPNDHRRVSVALTPKGDEGMRAMLVSLCPPDHGAGRMHPAERTIGHPNGQAEWARH